MNLFIGYILMLLPLAIYSICKIIKCYQNYEDGIIRWGLLSFISISCIVGSSISIFGVSSEITSGTLLMLLNAGIVAAYSIAFALLIALITIAILPVIALIKSL